MTEHAVHWDPAVVALVERERRRALNEAAEAIEADERRWVRHLAYDDGMEDAARIVRSLADP